MALSDRMRDRWEAHLDQSDPHKGAADGYGSPTAADIARFGVHGRQEQPQERHEASVEGRLAAEDHPEVEARPACEAQMQGGTRRKAEEPPQAEAPSQEEERQHAESRRAAKRDSKPKASKGAFKQNARPKRRARGKAAAKPDARSGVQASAAGSLSLATTDHLADEERRTLRRKVVICMAILAVLTYVSFGFTGAAGGDWGIAYAVYDPVEVTQALATFLYNAVANATNWLDPTDVQSYFTEWPAYFSVPQHAGVVLITLVCAVLLSVSGMLYQNVFKNPIAGPGMLGVSSGVSLGMMLLVYLYGADAIGAMTQRYEFCYGFGAAILAFVILAGRRLSGKGKPYDIVTMLLIGMILSQLIGFIVSFVTLFVMDPVDYQIYLTLSQMLQVDTSVLSWVALAIACVVSLAPVWLLRFRMNALAFDEQEVKLLGINFTALRAIALICGAIMILAAQIHIGAVAMVSLIVPFLSRAWFGCEFRKQLAGNVCIGTLLLLVCRDVVDLVPFVGDGIGIGSAVAVVALPVFLLLMARHLRGWE